MLAEDAAAAGGRPVLLTLVSEACLATLVSDFASLCRAAGIDVRLLSGGELGTSLGGEGRGSLESTVAGIVVIQRIDLVGGDEAQAAAATLLDDLARRGISSCVTVRHAPAVGELTPGLMSRLTGGLVVHVPLGPPDTPSHRLPWSLPRIVRTAARCHGLPATALVGTSRSRTVVQARNLAMYLARHLTGSSFGTIGAAFGGRDHTTVMRGVRAVERRLARDASFAAELDRLLAEGHDPRRRRGSRAS
jgi:hypothetical protein